MTVERSEETSAEIRRVALEMFATAGYDATSVRDIAAGVGIRGASVYHHFGSKEEVLWELTRNALELLVAIWRHEDGPGPREPESRLRAFVRASVRFHGTNQAAARLVNSELHRLAPEHYAQAVERRDAYQEELTGIVRACARSGRHSVDDVRLTVFAILQMTTGIANWFDPSGDLSLERVAEVYEDMALKLLAPAPPQNARKP